MYGRRQPNSEEKQQLEELSRLLADVCAPFSADVQLVPLCNALLYCGQQLFGADNASGFLCILRKYLPKHLMYVV